ncbi:hypothetical protein BLNAU_2829 [Blattamonas nauphoetae]|uniref:Uncharacterized protein n=1 Tax=Blattamonas nauphoetae TaxID=2049346 RepID=A0ABQ9YEN6_9EUKA|nr:hypothetical protein BLNAU_2829 [Blattamonas nauphoetae]
MSLIPLATQSPQNYPISTPLQPLSLHPFTPLPKQNHGPTHLPNLQPPTQSPPQPLPGAFITSTGLLTAPQGSIPISEPSQSTSTTLTKIVDQPDGHAPVQPQITQRNRPHRSEHRNPPSQSADLPKSHSPSTPIVSIDSAQLETISTAISSGHLGSIQKGRQNSTNTRGNLMPFPANLGQMMLNNAPSLKGTRITLDGQQRNQIQTFRPLPLLPIVEGEQLGTLKPLPLVPPK